MPTDYEKHEKSIMDRTYADLPIVGSKSNLNRLAVLGQFIGTESSIPRAQFIGYEDRSIRLYHYGREDGTENDVRPTVNFVQPAINTFTAQACKVPPLMTLKSSSYNEDGQWILIKPYTYHVPQDKLDEQGQPQINPKTGQPFQDIEFQLFEPIPDDVVEMVPAAKRVCIDTDYVVSHYQKTFDVHRRETRLDQTIRDLIFAKQLSCIPAGLVQWDPILKRPYFRIYPAQQWLPDPTEPDVKDMAYVRVDIVMDANKAKRLYPHIADDIDKYASRSLYRPQGSTEFSSIYLQTWQRPVVTLSLCFMRNQEAPMNLQEAIETGLVQVEEQIGDPQTNPAEGQEEGAGTEGHEADETSRQRGEPQPGPASSESVDLEPSEVKAFTGGDEVDESTASTTQPSEGEEEGGVKLFQNSKKITNTRTGEDLSACFDEEGNPVASYGEPDPTADGEREYHPNHPMKLVTRQWIQIYEKVVWDGVCPWWDIPVFIDKNVPIPGRPWSQPETTRLRTLQRDANECHVTMVNHVNWFKGPTSVMNKSGLTKVPADFVNGFAQPGKVYVIEGDPNADMSKILYTIPAPQMSDSTPKVFNMIEGSFQKVAGNPGVQNGMPPSGVSSGVAIAALQNEATVAGSFKSMYTEEAVWRIGKLMINAEVNWMEAEDIYRINRSAPLEVVQRYIVPFARQMLWDLDVELHTGAGAVRMQKEQTYRADHAAGILDPQTTREKLDYPHEEIARREKEQREELSREAQEAAQAAAPKGGAPEKISISVKYENLPPQSQDALLQQVGLPGGAQQMAVQNEAKAQVEAAVNAAAMNQQGKPPTGKPEQ